MRGLMQDWPLLVHTILDHASKWHGDREIVSRTVEGPIHRYTYADLDRRARQLASAAEKRLGIKLGDMVGTMAWNGYRHMETWYAIMGLGAVVHTLNPRLFHDQLTYIINHAEDGWIFTDTTFVPIFEKLQSELKTVKGYVIMTDRDHMPAETSLPNVVCYEDLLAEGDADFQWPAFDENTACGMCYTSGTTGNPKGVLYSHRSNVIHAMVQTGGDAMDAVEPGNHPAGGPDVPCQCLVAGVFRPHVGCQAGSAGRPHGRRGDLRIARWREGHLHRGGPHHLADAVAAPGKIPRSQAAPSEAGDHRRRRLSRGHDADLRGRL